VKNKKPPIKKLIAYIAQAVVCAALIAIFFVLLANGRSLGVWSFTVVFAFVFFVIGVWGVYLWIKDYTKPEIDENWFTKFKD